MQHSARLLAVTATLALTATGAHAAVTISSGATANMSCANGVCAPTAKDAVLNVGDLENMLASGNVEVTTTGSGVQAKDIVVKAALTWSASSALTLDAYRSITVDQSVSVTGTGGMTLTTNDGGSGGVFLFGEKGNIALWNATSGLTINGNAYGLVYDIATLASDIASNPSGNFALAMSYDAKVDGTYSGAPIQTVFTGRFEGLGNSISRLSINSSFKNNPVGLFRQIGTPRNGASALVENIRLSKAHIRSGKTSRIGALAAVNYGTLSGDTVSGKIAGGNESFAGALVGDSTGIIELSSAAATVSSGLEKLGGVAGGLVGANGGIISSSFATGTVSGGTLTSPAELGGLAGLNEATISDCYATGPVSGPGAGLDGGLVGENLDTVTDSYSTGAVSGGSGSTLGGLIAFDLNGTYTDDYWDTTTSGINQGCGNDSCSGVTGLTTQQLQAGLPSGFDPAIWGEKPNINGALPYLLANPPPK